MVIIHDDDVDINNNQGNEDSDLNNGDGKKNINIYKGNGSNSSSSDCIAYLEYIVQYFEDIHPIDEEIHAQ